MARPRKPDAKSNAERQREFRERQKAAGKARRWIYPGEPAPEATPAENETTLTKAELEKLIKGIYHKANEAMEDKEQYRDADRALGALYFHIVDAYRVLKLKKKPVQRNSGAVAGGKQPKTINHTTGAKKRARSPL